MPRLAKDSKETSTWKWFNPLVIYFFFCCFFTDTYDHGKQDIVKEKKMDLPDEEDKEMKQENVAKDEDTESEKPLLPPEVFEHLKNSETGEKKEDKLIIGRKLNLHPGASIEASNLLTSIAAYSSFYNY